MTSALIRTDLGLHRLLALLTAILLGVATLAAIAPTAAAQDDVTPARIDGQTRFHTAANLATFQFDEASVAHIVFAGDFPDALAASFAAGVAGGPILLVPSEEVGADSPTMQALEELSTERVVLVGGTDAISDDVEQEFADHGYETERIEGADRYDTAATLATHYGDIEVGTVEGQRTALLASGEAFPDALSAGPLANGLHLPLLLTPRARADARVDAALDGLDIERIIVIGGPAAVTSDVVTYYEDRGYEMERFGGETRTETAAIVADNATERFGFSPALSLLAQGDDYPDALAASVHGGVHLAPILLSATSNTLSPETHDWLATQCPDVDAIRAIGGTLAVSAAVLDAAVDAAEQCFAEPHTEQSYIQAPQEVITAEPGWTFEITVSGFDANNPAPVDIALFPCDVAAPADPDDATFRDTAGDGFADGIGTTETGHAVITSLHGESTAARHLDAVHPDENGRIDYTIHSDEEDCTIPVAFHDANGNDQLDVDEQGRPLEHFNYTKRGWDQDG